MSTPFHLKDSVVSAYHTLLGTGKPIDGVFHESRLPRHGDDVANTNRPAGDDLRPQTTFVMQSFDHRLTGQLFKMRTRLAQSDAPRRDFANLKLSVHQVVQRHLTCDNVSARILWSKLNTEFPLQSVNVFHLDQGELTIRIGCLKRSSSIEVAIAPQALFQVRLVPDPESGRPRLHSVPCRLILPCLSS